MEFYQSGNSLIDNIFSIGSFLEVKQTKYL